MRKNRDYLLFIRFQPCVICGSLSEPQHIRKRGIAPDKYRGGTGLKPYDYMAVPMCREHHEECESDYKYFEKLHNLNLKDVIIDTLIKYIEHVRYENER